MKSKTKLFTFFFTALSFTFLCEILYMKNVSTLGVNKEGNSKNNLKVVIAPQNLAVYTDVVYLKNKSYSNIFDILPSDGELQINSKQSFVY